MSDAEILFEVKDGLGVMTLNRPKALNSLSHGMILEMEKILPQWEIIDYAYAGKPDAPSGTVRELAMRMGRQRQPALEVPLEETRGLRETRGGTVAGSQVHAVRLPGFVLGAETIFGLPDQTLSIRHNAGGSAKPYVDGALLAIRKVSGLRGLHRGLDAVLEL